MLYDEREFPSVEDIEDGFGRELPEADEEWNRWWHESTMHRYEFLSRKHDEGEEFPSAA